MANELQISTTSGQSLYAVAISMAGQWFNTATGAFEAQNTNNWTNYVIALSEAVAGTGIYFGSVPQGLTAGIVLLSVYLEQTPGTPAYGDVQYPDQYKPLVFVLDWTGNQVNSLAPLGKPLGPTVQLPSRQQSAIVAQKIVDALYAARLTIAGQGFARVNVDGQDVQFNNPKDLDEAILFWERKVAVLTGRRRRNFALRLDGF